MSQKIQIRRGLNTNRTNIVFDIGEPAYTTDTQQFYLGDGITTGGNLYAPANMASTGYVGLPSSGASYAVVPTSNNTLTNGLNLIQTYTNALTATPYGNPLTSGNRFIVLVPPGVYDMGNSGIVCTSSYIDIIGLSSERRSAILQSYSKFGSVIKVNANDVRIRNLCILGINTGGFNNISYLQPDVNGINNHVLSNVELISSGFQSTGLNVSNATSFRFCLFENIKSFGTVFPNSSASYLNSTFFNCEIYGDLSFAWANNKYLLLQNCRIYGNSGFFQQGVASQDTFTLIESCYISGIDWFAGNNAGLNQGYKGKIKNTMFFGTIKSFAGQMDNCYINATSFPDYPINLSGLFANAVTPPSFTYCNIIAGSNIGASITGGVNMSGIVSFCRLNAPIYTGVTGISGPLSLYNIITSPSTIT